MKKSSRQLLSWLSLVALCFVTEAGHAQDTHTWSGGSGSWSNSGNWTPSGPPANLDSLQFNGTGGMASNDISGLIVRNLAFYGAGSYTLDGSQILKFDTAQNTNITVTGTADHEIKLELDMGGADRFRAITVDGADQTLTLSGGITGNFGYLQKFGLGTLALTGASSYSGDTYVNGGHWNVNSGGQVSSDGASYLGIVSGGSSVATVTGAGSLWQMTGGLFVGGGYEGTLNVEYGGRVAASFVQLANSGPNAGNLHLKGNSVSRGVLETGHISESSGSGGGQIHFDGGILRATGNQSNFIQNFEAGDVQILAGGAFIDTNGFDVGIAQELQGVGGLTKQGAGTLTLTGGNTYAGGTHIQEGTLQVGDGGTLGYGNVEIGDGATLVYNLSSGASQFGEISGAGSLVKQGIGQLILSTGPNTYSGTTTISQGTLTVYFGSSLGSGDVAVHSSATLHFHTGGSVAIQSGAISGAGELHQSSSGKVILTGDNTGHSGLNRITGGTVQVGDGGITGSLGSGNVQISSGAALVFDRSGTVVQSGAISGAGALAKQGTGTVVVTGNNIGHTGTTTISQGTLQVGDGGDTATGNLGTGDVVNNAALVYNRRGHVGQIGAISGSGSLTKTGDGWLYLIADNTYTGGTFVNEGSLIVYGSLGNTEVTVAANAILGGSGSIGGDTTIHGIHSPGNSPGVQTFGGSLTYASGSSVLWELTNSTASTAIQPGPAFTFDQIVVGVDLDFDGPTTLDLSFNSSGSNVLWTDGFWSSDQQWLLYDVGGTIGGIGNFALNVTDYQDSDGNLFGSLGAFDILHQGNQIFLTYTAMNFAAVPEPSSALLLLGGLATMLMGRRRRQMS